MDKPPLGRLKSVDLRDYWQHEELEFTPWLAEDENLSLLSDTLGIELELQAQEANVGPFRADLVCRNIRNDSVVLIENQLERTDHTHLGQIITYAAGLDAVSVVWIARQFTEEHRAAVDWLNRISDDDFYFFGLEVELWQIGGSDLAPKFDLVAKPNEWSKTIKVGLTSAQQLWLDYWREFGEYLELEGARFSRPKPQKSHWVGWGVGRAGFELIAVVSSRDKHVDVLLNLIGDDAKVHFHLLRDRKEEIESNLGLSLDWLEKPDQKGSSIVASRAAETTDREMWPELHAWTLQTLAAFDDAFRPLVARLDASAWEPVDSAP